VYIPVVGTEKVVLIELYLGIKIVKGPAESLAINPPLIETSKFPPSEGLLQQA